MNASLHQPVGLIFCLSLLLLLLLIAVIFLKIKTREVVQANKKLHPKNDAERFNQYISNLDSKQIETLLKLKHQKNPDAGPSGSSSTAGKALLIGLMLFSPIAIFAQSKSGSIDIFSEAGFLIVISLILIPILLGIVLMVIKVMNVLKQHRIRKSREEAEKLAKWLADLPTGRNGENPAETETGTGLSA